jgi:hypothetical protein
MAAIPLRNIFINILKDAGSRTERCCGPLTFGATIFSIGLIVEPTLYQRPVIPGVSSCNPSHSLHSLAYLTSRKTSYKVAYQPTNQPTNQSTDSRRRILLDQWTAIQLAKKSTAMNSECPWTKSDIPIIWVFLTYWSTIHFKVILQSMTVSPKVVSLLEIFLKNFLSLSPVGAAYPTHLFALLSFNRLSNTIRKCGCWFSY